MTKYKFLFACLKLPLSPQVQTTYSYILWIKSEATKTRGSLKENNDQGNIKFPWITVICLWPTSWQLTGIFNYKIYENMSDCLAIKYFPESLKGATVVHQVNNKAIMSQQAAVRCWPCFCCTNSMLHKVDYAYILVTICSDYLPVIFI